ncbi:MAG: hypothetical protein ACRDWV_07425 [Acidimicrobiales bacterium]
MSPVAAASQSPVQQGLDDHQGDGRQEQPGHDGLERRGVQQQEAASHDPTNGRSQAQGDRMAGLARQLGAVADAPPTDPGTRPMVLETLATSGE